MMMKKPLSIALLILIVLIIVISGVFFTAPSTPNFQQYPAGKARKAAFFNYFMPLVTANNQEISIIRAKLLDWRDHKNNIGWWDARQIADLAEQYYAELQAAGIEVLLDDRKERPGVMFADHELIGTPVLLVVGERNLDTQQIEVKDRISGEKSLMAIDDVMSLFA